MNAKVVFVSFFIVSHSYFSQVKEQRVVKTIHIDAPILISIEQIAEKSENYQTYSEKDYVISFCQEYAPEYVSLIQSSYSSPNNWTRTVGGIVQPNNFNPQNREELIDEFESIIHETTHHKNSFNGFLIEPSTYLVLSNQESQISNKFFKSDVIDKVVSAEAQEKLFRYKTYVSKQSGVGANVEGIVGLMDEYSAYQNGCSATLIAYDNALKNKDTTLAITFLKSAMATHYAYYEFNIFIGAYVQYARLYNPEVYNQILNLTTLKKAYTLNTQRFLNSLQIIKSAPTRLKGNYQSVKYTADYYNKTYVDFAKEYMKIFDSELQTLKSNL
ncbi:MAG: hypothetical protein FJZ67_11590 [Bacteroidetes bacterium]|nr:hypothetical protein [Bacteroidota bacterium]